VAWCIIFLTRSLSRIKRKPLGKEMPETFPPFRFLLLVSERDDSTFEDSLRA